MAEGADGSAGKSRKPTSDDHEEDPSIGDPLRLRATGEAVNTADGESQSSTTEPPKKEDNPFSFKHFLRSGNSSYQSQGARPKVYCDGKPVTSVPSDTDRDTARVVAEFSSALPDFVQDHLAVDFTPPRPLNLDSGRKERRNHPVPLDLPVRPPAEFPLDLPLNQDGQAQARSCPPSGEVAVSKSLPDFLADGAVRTQNDNSAHVPSPERDLDRYRQELEICRRQLSDERRRSEHLQRQLDLARNKEKEYAQNLGKALEQVEHNLEINTKRMVSSENIVIQLRKEIKGLQGEVSRLKRENADLRCEEGAAGGSPQEVPASHPHTSLIARDLRMAATTAEQSLRQLLTGVDNLRIIASTLDSMSRLEETTMDPLLDYDGDCDTTGPAL